MVPSCRGAENSSSVSRVRHGRRNELGRCYTISMVRRNSNRSRFATDAASVASVSADSIETEGTCGKVRRTLG
jgi:hypothetical protein